MSPSLSHLTLTLPSSILASLVVLLLPTLPYTSVRAQTDNGEGCTCFRTNLTSNYFTNHLFRDFRNIKNGNGTVPRLLEDEDSSAHALATSDYFLGKDWTSMWTTQSWNNSDTYHKNSASVFMLNSPSNVYIEKSKDSDPTYSTYLTLRTARLPNFQTAAELNSVNRNFHHLSLRFLARVTGSAGACAGIFTYLSNDEPEKVQEADIEILTMGPRNKVQYTNQPSDSDSGNPISQATQNSTTTQERDWTLWNEYRYDWTKEAGSVWYVNGVENARIKFQAPKDPTQIMVNMWSDGGLWTGNMTLYEQAYLQIQWMQVVFNTTGPVTGLDTRAVDGIEKRDTDGVGAEGQLERRKGDKGCEVVCAVDGPEVNIVGYTDLIINKTGSAVGGWKEKGRVGKLIWISTIAIGVGIYGLL